MKLDAYYSNDGKAMIVADRQGMPGQRFTLAVVEGFDADETQRYAELLSAAPDLLKAAMGVLPLLASGGFDCDDEPPTPEVVALKAAIAKAQAIA